MASDTAAMSPAATPIRYVDAAHVLLSNGWVTRGANERHLPSSINNTLPSSMPLMFAPTCVCARSLEYNELDANAKDQLTNAARAGLVSGGTVDSPRGSLRRAGLPR